MLDAIRVTFHSLAHSTAIEAAIRQRAENLERFHRRIHSCHVIVKPWSRRHHRGNLYTVTIDVTVPGAELAVGRTHTASHAHEDPYVAIHYAFADMRRLLQDRARRERDYEKSART